MLCLDGNPGHVSKEVSKDKRQTELKEDLNPIASKPLLLSPWWKQTDTNRYMFPYWRTELFTIPENNAKTPPNRVIISKSVSTTDIQYDSLFPQVSDAFYSDDIDGKAGHAFVNTLEMIECSHEEFIAEFKGCESLIQHLQSDSCKPKRYQDAWSPCDLPYLKYSNKK